MEFSDTDSVCLVMTDEMDQIVKPNLRKEWESAKKNWFVLDETDAFQTRLPGLLKSEWKTTNGGIAWSVFRIKTLKLKTFNSFNALFFKFVSEILHGDLLRQARPTGQRCQEDCLKGDITDNKQIYVRPVQASALRRADF